MNIGEKIAGSDKKLWGVISILIQNTLFGDEGVGVQDIYDICDGDIGETKIRNCILTLKNKELILVTKDGRKELYDINTNKLTEME